MNGLSESIDKKEAEDWLSSNFPRLFDLYQRSKKDEPKNYFNFKELFPIALLGYEAYAQTEKRLARLDAESWEKLREKALDYVTVDDPLRRYQQLFNTLDEARGYVFLADQGYVEIEFIERKKGKQGKGQSPDLRATRNGLTAILEVKTINESDATLDPGALWRREAVKVREDLSVAFKDKLVSTIEQARNQLNDYPEPSDRKIVLLVVCFDIGQKTSAQSYVELESFIASQSMQDGIEVYCQSVHERRGIVSSAFCSSEGVCQ